MSKRTICTCDLCGEDKEPVSPIRLGFNSQQPDWRSVMYRTMPLETYAETLTGDACNKCMRLLIEDLRKRFYLKYEIKE